MYEQSCRLSLCGPCHSLAYARDDLPESLNVEESDVAAPLHVVVLFVVSILFVLLLAFFHPVLLVLAYLLVAQA